MTETTVRGSATKIVLVLAAMVVIIGGLKLASSIIAPILLAAFIAIVLSPAIAALVRRGLSTGLAIATICLSVLVLGGFVGIVFYSSVTQFNDALPTYQAEMAAKSADFTSWLDDHGIDASGTLSQSAFTGASLANVATRLIGWILTGLSSFLLLYVLTVFFLVDAGLFITKGKKQLSTVEERWPALTAFVKNLQHFFLIKSFVNLIVASCMVLLLLLFDVPYPWLWGIIGFFMSYIPSIGLILASIPPVILAFITNGVTAAVVIAVGVTIVNQLGDNVILPLMSRGGLNMPMSIQFVSFMFWSWVLGPAGAILALPLMMAVRLLLSMSPQTRWAGHWLTRSEVKTAHGDDATRASPDPTTAL
jgi:AI-2 transport protein TqsA